jgi:hypothetical protein
MAGAELANGVHEGALALEEGRGGEETRCESSEQDGAGRRPMFSVPFLQKVCILLSYDGCFSFLQFSNRYSYVALACKLTKNDIGMMGEGWSVVFEQCYTREYVGTEEENKMKTAYVL